MAISQVPPLSSNVPIVYPPGHPSAGCPTPAFATLMQILLDEKAITDALAAGAIQPGTVTTSGLTAAAQRILGNKEATTGAIEELTLSQVLDLIGSAAQGDLLFRGAAGWQRLAAGTSGKFLKTLGAGADPAWDTPASGGGSAAWTLAASWIWSANVATVPFTGLAGASDIMVVGIDITQSAGSSAALVQVSTNNGSSYYSTSGDYVFFTVDTGVKGNTVGGALWATGSSAARGGVAIIKAANVTGAPRVIESKVSSGSTERLFVADNSNDIDAIRVIPSGAGVNFTGGSIYIYTR